MGRVGRKLAPQAHGTLLFVFRHAACHSAIYSTLVTVVRWFMERGGNPKFSGAMVDG